MSTPAVQVPKAPKLPVMGKLRPGYVIQQGRARIETLDPANPQYISLDEKGARAYLHMMDNRDEIIAHFGWPPEVPILETSEQLDRMVRRARESVSTESIHKALADALAGPAFVEAVSQIAQGVADRVAAELTRSLGGRIDAVETLIDTAIQEPDPAPAKSNKRG